MTNSYFRLRTTSLMQQRKNPVKRAFSGLAGRPSELEPEAVPAPIVPAETAETPVADVAPKRRGRPPKNGRAMSGQERIQKYRQDQQRKLEDKARRDLVARLVTIHRRLLPFADPESPKAGAILAERRHRLQKILDEWILLPVDDLRKTLQVYEERKDSEGRLPGESSGEADRSGGMSGVEQQIAKAEGQRHGSCGEGLGTATSNYNTEREPSTRAPNTRSLVSTRVLEQHTRYIERREAIIAELIEQYVRKISLDEDQPAHRCLLCEAKLPEFSDAQQHFWEEYDKGLQLFYRYQELTEDRAVAEMASFIVSDARKAYLNHKHLQEVWRVSRELSRKGE